LGNALEKEIEKKEKPAAPNLRPKLCPRTAAAQPVAQAVQQGAPPLPPSTAGDRTPPSSPTDSSGLRDSLPFPSSSPELFTCMPL